MSFMGTCWEIVRIASDRCLHLVKMVGESCMHAALGIPRARLAMFAGLAHLFRYE
jgi:hypothetical protein